MDILKIIKENTTTFPNPLLVIKHIHDEKDIIFLGMKDKGPVLSRFDLIQEKNERYYPKYKPLEGFQNKDNLESYECYITGMYDSTDHEIILDNIHFKDLYLNE